MRRLICALFFSFMCMSIVWAVQLNKLVVDIQNGFKGQNVTVIINNICMWSSENSFSDEVISFVDSFEFRYTKGTNLIVKVIVDKEEYVKELKPDDEIFLGIQRENNNIVFEISKIPFVYD
ncbi:hypothetical protein LCGC14_3092980 [marine sediment metagenome]|uniref:Uncharacterized protein n=1 Tax=marine sediment metagenome TaxID=412755 RepID=A0A0F8WAG6_9ZZZZ|nr:hypothetical protein [Porticoccus sp.]